MLQVARDDAAVSTLWARGRVRREWWRTVSDTRNIGCLLYSAQATDTDTTLLGTARYVELWSKGRTFQAKSLLPKELEARVQLSERMWERAQEQAQGCQEAECTTK